MEKSMIEIAQAVKVLEHLGYKNIRFDMGDAHAQYFIGQHQNQAWEVKVVHDTGEVAFRSLTDGSEDWMTEHWIEEE